MMMRLASSGAGFLARYGRNCSRIRTVIMRRAQRAARMDIVAPAGRYVLSSLSLMALIIVLSMLFVDDPIHRWASGLPSIYRDVFVCFTYMEDWFKLALSTTSLLFLVMFPFIDLDRFTARVRAYFVLVWTYTVLLCLSILVSMTLAYMIKWGMGRARPALYEQGGVIDFHFFMFERVYNSFPSGHSVVIAVEAAILFLIFPSWRWLILAIACWGSLSRIFVGAHYFSDVIAGAGLGVMVVLLCARWMARHHLGFALSTNGRIVPWGYRHARPLLER